MTFKKLVVGPLEENCYIVYDPDSSENKCFIVDPGAGGSRIVNCLKAVRLTPTDIYLTHGHFDHIMAVGWLLKEYPEVKVHAHEAERAVIEDPEKNLLHGMDAGDWTEGVDYVKEGKVLQMAGINMEVIFTPGHTEGSSVLYLEKEGLLFSGDTLFRESVGRTDLPSGNTKALRESVRDKLMILPDTTRVCPGHGEETSLEHEKKYNFIMFDF